MARTRQAKGRLVVYLGATAGAGKTYAMLGEAHALRNHRHDVVVAYVETFGRPRTVEMLRDLRCCLEGQRGVRGRGAG